MNPTIIPVTFMPTLFHSDNGFDWTCDHASTSEDTIEHYDHYRDAVTGTPQPLSYEPVKTCDDCPAWFSYRDEEWHDEQ